MLEFREEFFEQEIREGFYIDETMKRMWSAQLEVLQVIAEICDKYGLQWFAVFGTLLGAIRHEGFVPWDDDMDIAMKRADYMKFLQVLPEEMPEGFRCFSPMNEEGYTEYHSILLNGNSVSISPERLERFHGCPFSVGIDIFPLDYLPRDKNERNLQRTLFNIVGRAVLMIKNLTDPTVDKEDKAIQEEDEYYIQELKDALEALKEYCHLQIEEELLEKKEWEKLYKPLWKLGNELAMMYREDEADELVMYGDYATWEHKKYPKEWFAEAYAATFEDFMIAVPCGYDAFLKNVYGDYNYRVRGGGMHDYPYYNRQLKLVREKVREIMGQAQNVGMASQDIMFAEDEKTIPEEWQRFLDQKEEGKKVMLFGCEYEPFILHGAKALDKIETALQTFYEARDRFVLWWRPKPQVLQLLAQIDPGLEDRYRKIREDYIKGNWGILDETNDADRAAENCDAYYGDMGYVLQPLQKERKPILLITYPEGE